MKIAIGADHAGYDAKVIAVDWLKTNGYEVNDLGTHSADSVDYPDFAHAVGEAVQSGQSDLGILVCGSGNGVCITANKHQAVRAALCWEPELGALARQHNNANVLCLPARFVSTDKALEIVSAYLEAEFEGGRHQNRVNKIEAC
jgi:ribose 5-phosphate isomerase B